MRKRWRRKKVSNKLVFSSLVIISIIFLDQLTKVWVIKSGIAHACNTGFAFGIFEGIFNGLITFLVLLGVIYVFITTLRHPEPFDCHSERSEESQAFGSEVFDRESQAESAQARRGKLREGSRLFAIVIGLVLIIGGGASNIVDRLTRGCVVDFIDLKVWPAFNLADAAISMGTIILIFSLLKKR